MNLKAKFLLLDIASRFVGLVCGQIALEDSSSLALLTFTASIESSSEMDPATTAQASGTFPTTSLESLDSTTQSKSNHTDVVLPVTLVIVFLVILCLGLLYVFRRRWLRRNRFFGKPYPDSPVTTPSILSFSAGFSVNSDDHRSGYKAIPNPYTYYIPPPALVRSTSPQLSVSTSLLSLPKSLYVSVP
ncbi:hypothetical protein EV361DRAFT_893506 [Lentinula raphanica]|uniref:Uncharacterized protein n=1 Tax=Lentinula raphanica TaxID=153919 RepID=A0AA38P116_9AGAR|nr:hypothetical protein F5878DRAFT_630821 [Lentinula raphanica]KAJ3974656.1 hypothetical protein EV361DRAFT_893506 [Lentinula raphanica]